MKPLNYHGLAYQLPKTDKRLKRFAKQRKTRGFDDTETWALDFTIAQFVLPRLKHLRDHRCGYPGCTTSEEWDKILGEMIAAFELLAEENLSWDTVAEMKRQNRVISRGLRRFASWYRALWT